MCEVGMSGSDPFLQLTEMSPAAKTCLLRDGERVFVFHMDMVI